MRSAVLVEDLPDTRDWLRALILRAFPDCDLQCAATLQEGREALSVAPDLLIVDLNLPDGNGVTLLREVKAQSPETLCVVATIMSDDATIVGALSAGADGYLLKETATDMLVHQLRQMAQGVPALSPAIARRIMEHFRLTGPVEIDAQLTQRERDVLALIGRGLRTAEVAGELGLAQTTVAGYIKTIYRKLGISSRAEAAWHATRMGLRGD
ncbi:response regulator transcription factor [Jannaschia sp.]|nr:response regulator transcription factor [Jannaschia sp.]